MESSIPVKDYPDMDTSVNIPSEKNDIVVSMPISYVKAPNAIKSKPRFKETDCKPRFKETDSAVLVRDLCKGYDRKGPRVLNNFCMDVKKGTIYGLLGSSGCGKTTALSCIVGLKKWESGEILVFGEKPGTKESGIPGRRLGYVPQDIALYDQLDPFENIQYYGRLYGMSSQEIADQWSVLVNLLQLPSDFRLVQNLSGGQKRRTSLAIALIHTPELLILDEPTVGLDPLLRESVWQHLHEMVKTHRTSIIITTHYIEESRNSDTIGVMRHGYLLVEDSPSILMEEYKTDLLEDVVLKLCWNDTNRHLKRGSTVSMLGENNNPRHLLDLFKDDRHLLEVIRENLDSDDDDSGTGTDNDNVDLNGTARSNREFCDSEISNVDCDSSSGNSSTNNANSLAVPKQSRRKHTPPPAKRRRSRSSEAAGALFQSRWKPEQQLESVVVPEENSVDGNYKQSYGFDLPPPSQNARRPTTLQHKSSWDIWEQKEKSKTGAKKCVSEFTRTIGRIRALCCVVYLSLLRHPVFFLAALVCPAAEVILTISSVGKEPIGLKMAVVNEEMPDWLTKCPWDELNIQKLSKANGIDPSLLVTSTMAPVIKDDDHIACDFSALSCKYLNLAAHGGVMNLIPYDSTEQAVADVKKGGLWGYIHFRSNYSQHMIDRLATKQFAFDESVNGSTISLRMDMSQYLGSVIIIQEVFDALQGYIQQLIGSCDLGARQAEIPLHFRNPVYGELDASYHNFLIPGVLANIIFMMTFAISGLMFITDLKLGTMGRARVAGLKTFELFMAYTITQGSMVVMQVIICSLCLKIGFDFEIEGSISLYIACTLLLGMCGQAFGLMMGIISQDEIEALISALFILPLMLMFGGVIWPLDCMAPFWKYIGSTLPTTLITESLRSIVTRGVGITHGLLYPGIIVTSAWLVFFWIGALIAYRICIK